MMMRFCFSNSRTATVIPVSEVFSEFHRLAVPALVRVRCDWEIWSSSSMDFNYDEQFLGRASSIFWKEYVHVS